MSRRQHFTAFFTIIQLLGSFQPSSSVFPGPWLGLNTPQSLTPGTYEWLLSPLMSHGSNVTTADGWFFVQGWGRHYVMSVKSVLDVHLAQPVVAPTPPWLFQSLQSPQPWTFNKAHSARHEFLPVEQAVEPIKEWLVALKQSSYCCANGHSLPRQYGDR